MGQFSCKNNRYCRPFFEEGETVGAAPSEEKTNSESEPSKLQARAHPVTQIVNTLPIQHHGLLGVPSASSFAASGRSISVASIDTYSSLPSKWNTMNNEITPAFEPDVPGLDPLPLVLDSQNVPNTPGSKRMSEIDPWMTAELPEVVMNSGASKPNQNQSLNQAKRGSFRVDIVKRSLVDETSKDFKQRDRWQKGTAVEIFITHYGEWIQGVINNITYDDIGEWLVVEWTRNGIPGEKQIQRHSTQIRPLQTSRKIQQSIDALDDLASTLFGRSALLTSKPNHVRDRSREPDYLHFKTSHMSDNESNSAPSGDISDELNDVPLVTLDPGHMHKKSVINPSHSDSFIEAPDMIYGLEHSYPPKLDDQGNVLYDYVVKCKCKCTQWKVYEDPIAVFKCHCTICRGRNYGNAMIWVVFPEENVFCETRRLSTCESPRGQNRFTCSKCSTFVYMTHRSCLDMLYVNANTIENRPFHEEWLKEHGPKYLKSNQGTPCAHIWASSPNEQQYNGFKPVMICCQENPEAPLLRSMQKLMPPIPI